MKSLSRQGVAAKRSLTTPVASCTDATSSARRANFQEIDPSVIGPDTPVRLKVAARLFYPDGSMTVSGLRVMINRGLLESELTANKVYVTKSGIERMRERCRENRRAHVSGSSPKSEIRRETSTGNRHGSSETERASSALAALQRTAAELNKPSRNTSQASTPSPATGDVIPLKS